MTKKTLSVVGIIIILVLIGAVSFNYGYQQGGAKPRTLEVSNLIKARSAVVFGEVTAISGRTLTLAAGGDILSIPIREKTQVRVGTTPMEFSEIKIGDKAEIVLQLGPGNFFEGINIMIPLGQE